MESAFGPFEPAFPSQARRNRDHLAAAVQLGAPSSMWQPLFRAESEPLLRRAQPQCGKTDSMGQTILYEGHNLTHNGAAGIATYAKNVAVSARALGYATKVLVGSSKALPRKDPVFSEVSEVWFYDARSAKRPSMYAALVLPGLFGKPFGIRPVEFRSRKVVVGPSPNLSDFETILAAPYLMHVTRLHFIRYKHRAFLNLDSSPTIFHATQPMPLKARKCPNLYTIHDLVPLRLPYATLDNKKYFFQLVRHLCKKADHIVTVSECSKQDIIRFFGISEDRITNTYQAVEIPDELTASNEDKLAAELRQAFDLGYKEYFLFCGAIEPKKNVSRLVDAYAASGTPHPLVIAGGLGWQYEIDVEKIQDERFLSYRMDKRRIIPERRVRRFDYLPFAQLVSLIRGARALLFPSLYEGFGLPVLEAMQLGTPVMTSNTSSLPEITGDAAFLVDPLNIDAMAGAIRVIDQDAELRAELSAKGRERAKLFSPEIYQKRLADLYRRVF